MAQHMKAAGLTKLQRAGRVFEAFLLVLAAIFLGCLALAAPFITGYFINMGPEGVGADVMNLLTPFNGGAFIAFMFPALGLACLALFFLFIWNGLRRAPARAVVPCALLLLFAASVAWIVLLGTKTNFYNDSIRLDQYARALLSGDFDVFSADLGDQGVSYLRVYPFQSGSIWLLAGVYALFGVGNEMAFQLLSAVFVVVSAASLIFITGRLFPGTGTVALASVLVVLFAPLTFSAAFVYGNAIGFGLGCASLALNVAAMQQDESLPRRWGLFAAGAVVMLLALIVKSTFVIMLIALALAWLIVLVRERRAPQILIVLAAAVVINALTSVPVRLLESTVGMSFGDGMPKTSWIAMGLTWDPYLNRPGWWSPVQATHFAQVDGDAAAQGAFAMEAIKTALGAFLADPLYCIRFFVYKLMTEWLDPTFQSLYYSATSVSDATSPIAEQVMYNGYTANRVLTIAMDAYQSLFYIASFTGLVCAFRHRGSVSPAALLMVIAFLGGVACYLLWEAKSVYTMPFALLLLPFAAYGLRSLLDTVKR